MAVARGTVEIRVNSEETAAALAFTPDSGGLGWDVDAVIKLARETGIVPLPAAADLEKFISKAARAKEPMTTVIAESAGPGAALAESVAWEPLPIPPDMEAFTKETIAKGKGPLLFRIKTEKVKRDTIVKKRGKFPFMGEKEEIVTVWDKKEIREPVLVKPEPVSVRYAAANDRLGVFNAAKPGKPGKTVYGKPSPPPSPEDPQFYLGEGIRREKNDLYAVYGGFLRIGENWADILPLSKSYFEVKTGSDNVTLFLYFYPGDPRFPVPGAREVLAAAKEKADAADMVSAAEIEQAINAAVTRREDLQAFPLMLPREAEARVVISPDELTARLVLRKGVAGAPALRMQAISQAIRDSRVQGYDAGALKSAVAGFMQGKTTSLDYILVEGAAATRGADREVELTVKPLESDPAETLRERLKKDASAAQGFPAGEAEQLCLVKKNARIAQVSKAPNGEQGKDVFGCLLPGLPGNDPDLKLFRGLSLRGSDIIADEDGLLLVKGGAKTFWATITEYRDAGAQVQVSEDGMEAVCEFTSHLGAGIPLTMELVKVALAEAGVTSGINRDTIETGCKLAALKGTVTQTVARGVLPVPAGGEALSWLIPQPKTGIRMGVTRGMPLADLTVLPDGRAGFTVRGEAIAPDERGARKITHDASIVERLLPPEAGQQTPPQTNQTKRLFALFAGDFILSENHLSISNLKSVEGDVGPSSGKINFAGEVRITGSVHPGSTIMGEGDVIIAGSVEAALVSGSKVVIVQGIRGGGRGVVRAKTTIESSFAESATLLAVADITLINRARNCSIKTNGCFLCQGTLSGGVCRACGGIQAAELGDEEHSSTEISFGQNYLIQDQIEAAEREIEKLKTALARTDALIAEMAENPVSLESARTEKIRLLKILEQFKLKVFNLREKFEEHYASELRISGTVYPGVVMESHGRYYEINEKRQGAVFYFDRKTGRIMEKPFA
ncbi:MAG: FapA family protein [Treponema sp.]|jgi:uncharacterized protein (DUF342 family)|nr:FapA family protein [Treponema sp.]